MVICNAVKIKTSNGNLCTLPSILRVGVEGSPQMDSTELFCRDLKHDI